MSIANGGTGSTTQNFVDLTTNQTVAGEKTFSNTLKSDSIQTTGSSGVVIKNSSGAQVADFGPANTTNVSITGGLNVGVNLQATGTVTGSNLSGTNTGDGEAETQAGYLAATQKIIQTPNNQLTTIDVATKKYKIETGNNNELINLGFESPTVGEGWTISNATSSSSTTRIEGGKSLSLALTGALSLSQSSTINASQKSGVQMVASVWVNSSDVSDLQLCSLKNGSEDKCTVVGGYVQGTGWKQLTVSFLGNSTSNGLKLKSTDTTGTVLVDQAFVGLGSPIVDFTPDMVFSAKVSSAAAILTSNTDWLSSCSDTGAGQYNCVFKSGIFTQAPVCTGSNDDGNTRYATPYLATSTNVNITTVSGASSADAPFLLICQKQGADYKTSKAYVASSSDYGWTTFTPTSPNSSIAMSSSVCYYKREGEDLLIDCRTLASSPQASEMRISLPNNLTPSSNVYSLLKQCGYYHRSEGSANASKSGPVICETGLGYIRFAVSNYSPALSPFVPKNANEIIANGQTLTFNARIPIQGWTDSGVIVGSFQGYNETPGTSRVETFSVSYGTTNATTVCSASPCSYLDQIGNAVTSVTRSGTGVYSLNTSRTYSKLKCTGTASNGAQYISFQASPGSCSNCSSLSFSSGYPGAAADAWGIIMCQGIPQ